MRGQTELWIVSLRGIRVERVTSLSPATGSEAAEHPEEPLTGSFLPASPLSPRGLKKALQILMAQEEGPEL